MLSLWSRRPSRREVRRLHHWAVTSATTTDGVRARLAVDYTVRIEGRPELALSTVDDLVEEGLRELVATTGVAGLPAPGDVPAWQVDLPHGVVVETAVVTMADVEVSAELRRLVTGTG